MWYYNRVTRIEYISLRGIKNDMREFFLHNDFSNVEKISFQHFFYNG